MMSEQAQPPLDFAFGLHAHQPDGNFDHVFQDHLTDVYGPFLDHVTAGGFLPLTLHFSGPLLSWLEKHHSGYLDRVGRLAADGQVELLLAGYYEPVLPSLSREDRIQQVLWMKEALKSRFGVDATGLWLTERVWEPDLPADLAAAGVEYVLVDDRHFVAAGFRRDQLHAPFRTESSGRSLGVFPIDERLRYFIPFQPPEATADYLQGLRREGRRLAVFADDIEKFGGWPGTREWVYEKGWLDRFIGTLAGLRDAGEIRLTTFRQALAEVPSGGPAYLPSASYREMEEWSLPPAAFNRMAELKELLGEERFERGESPLIRGSHWRNFLVKYPESNRMHKKAMALSTLCREEGDPEEARRAIGRAQCNDAYWHGVFGGLYLRHLRDAVWRNLAEAEGYLRMGEGPAWEQVDLDLDGHKEMWVHSGHFSALVSPQRGGGVEELTRFQNGVNLANVLTRRREAYHEVNRPGNGGIDDHHRGGSDGHGDAESAPSIHDMEDSLRFTQLPPVDPDDRALFLERVLGPEATGDEYVAGTYSTLKSWAREPLQVNAVELARGPGEDPVPVAPLASREVGEEENGETGGTPGSVAQGGSVTVRMGAVEKKGRGFLQKTLRFLENGTVEAQFRWDGSAFPQDSFFTTEISLAGDAQVTTQPEGELWRFPISTFSKSERGFDETVQGESVLVRWPVEAGEGRVRIDGD